MTLKACLRSMRLRTLPLSEAGVLMGLFIAMRKGTVDPWTIVLLLLTTALLQILSNLSNELGDTLSGTDTAQRQGIRYSLQDGDMTVDEMKRLIAVTAVLCCCSGLGMVWVSFGTVFAAEPLALLALGAAAIRAAMHYTLGPRPYGYRGLGDIFVFIFFGIVSVCGGYYVCSHDLLLDDLRVLLPGAAIGLFSVGVLNVNNIRDMKTDAATRVTVALRLGLHRARIYQTVLLVLGWAILVLYNACSPTGDAFYDQLFLLTSPVFVLHLKGVWTKEERALDPMLPMLVMGTFLTVLLYGAPLLLK